MTDRLRVAGALWVGVLLLSSCGEADRPSGDDAGSCPASVERGGATFTADSRFGTPLQEGRPLKGVRITCPGPRERPVDAVAIQGIPIDVAFYAPDAYGPENIVVRDGTSLTATQLKQLTG